jgi:hypothetical protein
MRKAYIGSIAAFFLMVCGAASAAGSCTGCRVKNIGSGPYFDSICASGSCVFLALEGTVTGKAACSTNSYWHFVVNLNTPSGKSTLAQLLAAQATGQLINVNGSNSCGQSPSGVTEDLYWITYIQ